jgi:hypothetical protein
MLISKMENITNMENKYGINVERPTKDSENWYTIQQESFTIDKKEFVLNKFKEDFPSHNVLDFDQLEKVLTRSSKLQEWYSTVCLLYTDSIQLPLAYKDLISPKEYKEFFKDIQEYKDNLALESKEIEILSKKFSDDIKTIKNKYKKENDIIIDRNKIYPIIILNGSDLPLSLQIEIEGYTPKTGDITQQKSLYARELLINYKRSLIEHVKRDPDVDILGIIEDLKTK